MSDNKGIPFNLLTDEEVEELFHTVSDASGLEAVDNPKVDFLAAGLGNSTVKDIIDGNLPNDKVIYDTENDIHHRLGLGFNFCDENGDPTCYPELTCGKCNACKIRQASHAYFGGSPSRKIMMTGVNSNGLGLNPGGSPGHDIVWDPYLMHHAVRGGINAGLPLGALTYRNGPMALVTPPSGFGKTFRNGRVYNTEDILSDFYAKLTGSEEAWKGFIRQFTLPRAYHHIIKDIELGADGNVIATSSLVNGRVNVGTIGHIDRQDRPTQTVISVSDKGVEVAGKVIHKFPDPLRKHYFSLHGDHLGDSMLRNGRSGAHANPLEYGYNPLLLKPIKKPKREQWAQDAVDKMIYNDYIGNSDCVAIGKLQKTVLHNAKRALKKPGLKGDQSLSELFGKK